MRLLHNALYMKDIQCMADQSLPWDRLADAHILIAGATGLVGRCLLDLLMYMNTHKDLRCHVTALSSRRQGAKERLPEDYFTSAFFHYIQHNISEPCPDEIRGDYSYVLHLASNTHPVAYAERPIDTILTNVLGTRNLLDVCAENDTCQFVFPSSVEIYGENRGDTELFNEEYLGYINSNTLRAGYPESKRVCESLCQAYMKEKAVRTAIPRLPRIFGPTMKKDDSKALSQFIKKAVSGNDIVLKSDGKPQYSFLYVTDAITGILTTMFFGENGRAYNIADEACDGTLREAAEICASVGGSKVTYDIPDETEKQGYSTATKARLNGGRIRKLGWAPRYDLYGGLERTITILRQAGDWV